MSKCPCFTKNILFKVKHYLGYCQRIESSGIKIGKRLTTTLSGAVEYLF